MNIDFRDKKTLMMIAGALVAIGLISYWFFGRSSEGSDDGTGATLVESYSDPVEIIIGRELLTSLESMREIQLDVSFLNDEVLGSLKDFTVQIPKQPVGRRDPFAPLTE